jgi:hypothetical protein
MSDPGSAVLAPMAWGRRLAAVAIGAVIAWLLLIASVKAELPPPDERMQPSRRADNPGPIVRAIHVDVDGQEIDRAEIEHDIILTADVQDSKTAVSRLLFNWSVPFGEIRGEGARVAWHVPKGTSTPVSGYATLELTEQYPDFTSGLIPAVREHRTTGDGPMMHVNDSMAEITKMAVAFLVDYFGNPKVSPEACLVDFSDTCKGKADELDDIRRTRSEHVMRKAEAYVSKITFHPSMNAADIIAPCVFLDTDLKSGARHAAVADCLLTAVYDKPRWYLCDSHINGTDGLEDDLRARGILPRKP